jgi:DMSO/TMAO reductase YedYZ heme-binding membrane subunit
MARPAVHSRPSAARPGAPVDEPHNSHDRLAVRERPSVRERPGAKGRVVNPVDAWMDEKFKFAGSQIKRKTVACVLLGLPALAPICFISRAVVLRDNFVMDQIEADVLGTGGMINLMVTLMITPLVTLTGQHWFVPLRRWYGLMFACTAFTDATIASITTAFRGGVLGRLVGHSYLLVGFTMVMLAIPLFLTGNNHAQRLLGRYWKPLHRLTYVIWGLLWLHLALLEGLGAQNGTNGPSGLPDPFPFNVLHQRLYQLTLVSLPLVLLRLPPVKRWVAEKQAAGEMRDVWVRFAPLLVLAVLFFSFMINEELFKGIGAFRLQVPATPTPVH